jgi:hypothetical protein
LKELGPINLNQVYGRSSHTVDVNDGGYCDRPAAIKQAGARAKVFAVEFHSDKVADLFVVIPTPIADINPKLVICIMWFSGSIRRRFVSRSPPSPARSRTSPSTIATTGWLAPSMPFKRVMVVLALAHMG